MKNLFLELKLVGRFTTEFQSMSISKEINFNELGWKFTTKMKEQHKHEGKVRI